MQKTSRTHHTLSSINFSVGQTSKHLSTQSKRKKRPKKSLWRAVGIASATMLAPFASETAVASSFVNSYETTHGLVSLSHQTQSDQTQLGQASLQRIPLGDASNQSKVLSPWVESAPQVAFSNSYTLTAASQQPPAAVIDADNTWSLSYATQANTAQVNSAVQSVIAQVAADTTRAKACADDSCHRLTYIRSQLPVVSAKVQRLEEQLKDFSRQHGQGDISAYKTALANRLLEVTSQKQQLDIELDQTRLRAEQLKTQLSYVDVKVDSAEEILSEDTIYQVLWGQLMTVEENIQKEYSRVNTDTTGLNPLYDEYQALLVKTQVAAREALNRHLLAGGSQSLEIPYFPEPTAETFGALLVETHQQRVQQLRHRKLAALETGLIGRQQRLARVEGEYERLQADLLSEQSVLNSYQSERDQILATAPEAALRVSSIPMYDAQSVVAAQTLLPMLPNGSIAKTLLGIALAASMVAAESHRRAEKKAASLGKRILEIFPTSYAEKPSANNCPANGHTANRAKSQPQMIALSELTKETQVAKSAAEDIKTAGAKEIEIVESAGSLEVKFATEERPTQPDSFCIVNDLGEFEISESSVQSLDPLAAEVKVDDFKQALENLTPENHHTREIDSPEITPVRLPVADTDLFLEQVLEWISEDLALAAPVAASGEAKRTESVANSDSVVDSVVVDSVAADSVVADSVAAGSMVADSVAVEPATINPTKPTTISPLA